MLRVILVTESAAESDRMRAALERGGPAVEAVRVDTIAAWEAARAGAVDLVACSLPLPAGMTSLWAPDETALPTLLFAEDCSPAIVSEALRLRAALCPPGTDLAATLERAAIEGVARARRARNDAFEIGQRRVLEQMAGVVPLAGLLGQIVRLIESQQDGLMCSILLLDDEGKRIRHGAAPSLPDDYVRAIDGSLIGPHEGSCGAAAALGEPVFVDDIAVHPNWERYREPALRGGLRASWSTPIFGAAHQVLGTFAMYYREPRLPGPYEIELIEAATQLARIAITRHVNEERIRASERLRSAIHDQVTDVIYYVAVRDDTFRFASVNPAFLEATGLTEAQVVGRTRMVLPPEHPALARLAIIDRATSRASELVQQILTFSRNPEPRQELVQLAPIVQEAIDLLETTALVHVETRTDLDETTPDVLADPSQMHQIIVNLVTNAAHAMEGRKGALRITLRPTTLTRPLAGVRSVAPAGRYVQLTVADQGAGMTAETLERIFEPFFTTRVRGTGLGLSVALGIVRAHNGTVTVASRPDVGTTFDVYLPAVGTAVERAPSRPPPAERGHGERVWYVDDDESLVTLATHHLASLGYAPTGFTDAQAALRAFREDPAAVDALVVDYAMPGFSGMDLVREIRRLSPALPTVVVDGIVTPELRDETRPMGVRAVLAKADILHQLPGLIDELLA